MDTPTSDEFRRLYDAAMAFKQAAPWEWMTEEEVFGIRNPETGQIGYVSIMGHRGEYLALALYLGSEGLDGFLRMERGEENDNPAILLEIPQLQASFEDRDKLYPEDHQGIKALGLKFRGRQAWPMFRSYVPGYLPWFVTPAEARFLTAALEQALDVTRRLAKDRSLLKPLRQNRYLVRTRTDQGWADDWLTPPPPPVRAPLPVDTKRLAAMRHQFPQQHLTFQADLFVLPGSIKERDDPRPYLAYTLMVVEANSGLILGHEIMAPKPTLDAVWDQAPTKLLDVIAGFGNLPDRVVVRNDRLRRLFAAVITGLGCQIKVTPRLPALDHARAEMERFMRRF
jgi:hypothetical protein